MDGKSCCAVKTAPVKTDFRDKLKTYRPLVVILGVSALAALALPGLHFMQGWMGVFLLFLASLKLFNLQGFADSFMQYDLIAAKARPYALAYPFIELGLGFLYLSAFNPLVTGALTVIVMCAGIPGILSVIRRGQKVQCACVGAGLFSLPVGYVTLAENVAMAAMGLMTALYHA